MLSCSWEQPRVEGSDWSGVEVREDGNLKVLDVGTVCC